MKKESLRSFVVWFSLTTTVLSSVTLFVLLWGEAYVRWSLNQNFSFLGGFELSALALLVLGQVAALAYIHRPER